MTETISAGATPDEPDILNGLIARRVASLRKRRNLSFDEFAARCGVSKGMLVQIEQGRANPSIATLCRVAAGLHVSVAELVAPGEESRAPVRLVGPGEAARLWRGAKGGTASLLVGSDGSDMLELWHWELRPGERYEAQPHPAGTRELIHVTQGLLALEVDGTTYRIEAGGSAFACTDRPHAYGCAGPDAVRFTMAVAEPEPVQAVRT
ncbi:MAG: helix-turn-helix transcriptional regulator [Rhizobiales bacterium]|nr:helix-turn-helix transcriptional regulator [Hyphomicrobiales bacterium]